MWKAELLPIFTASVAFNANEEKWIVDEAVLTSGFSKIVLVIYADQSSATDGLKIHQSADGTNWHITALTVTAGTVLAATVDVIPDRFRISYKNGANATTVSFGVFLKRS